MALMSVAEALRQVLEHAGPLATETVPLADAYGRVLAADLSAQRTQPPADVSAMDGYAVRAADVKSAPVRLRLIGEVRNVPGCTSRVQPNVHLVAVPIREHQQLGRREFSRAH